MSYPTLVDRLEFEQSLAARFVFHCPSILDSRQGECHRRYKGHLGQTAGPKSDDCIQGNQSSIVAPVE